MGSSFCTAKISSGQEDINEKIIRMPNHRSLQHSTKDIQRMSSKEVDLSHFCFTNSCGSCLGIGGFGLVREIEHLQTEKKFALKSMSKYMLLQRNCGVGAVFIELQILQNLKLIVPAMQVYICNLHYAFQDDKFVYMVLDFCSGGDMRFNLNNVSHGRFDEGAAKFYICQALLALNACHQVN